MIVPEVNHEQWGRRDITHERPNRFFSGGPSNDAEPAPRVSKEPIGFRKRAIIDESWRLWSDYV